VVSIALTHFERIAETAGFILEKRVGELHRVKAETEKTEF